MRYGTCHFKSIQHAIRYYRPYGYDDVHAAVNRKLAEGEIHIGPPTLKEGETCYLDNDGRYIIEGGK